MDHSLTMHVDQAPRNVSQLQKVACLSRHLRVPGFQRRAYEFEPVLTWMGLYKLVDVPILHPPRHHSELVFGHCHPQQR